MLWSTKSVIWRLLLPVLLAVTSGGVVVVGGQPLVHLTEMSFDQQRKEMDLLTN